LSFFMQNRYIALESKIICSYSEKRENTASTEFSQVKKTVENVIFKTVSTLTYIFIPLLSLVAGHIISILFPSKSTLSDY
jgi:hypothetical protein